VTSESGRRAVPFVVRVAAEWIEFTDADDENRINTPSVNTFNPWRFRSYQPWTNDTVKGEWQTVVGSSLTTLLQYGYFEWDSLQYSLPPETPDETPRLGPLLCKGVAR